MTDQVFNRCLGLCALATLIVIIAEWLQ